MSYRISPSFGVRVTGLPATVLDDLRFTATWELVDRIGTVTRWLSEEGAQLADRMYEVIGTGATPEHKPLLVALRRALFTGRRPGARAGSAEVLAALPGDLAGRVTDWQLRLDDVAAMRAELSRVLAAETAQRVTALRTAVRAEVFRRGLAQGSRVLSTQLEVWLAAAEVAAPPRQVLLRLAKYLARAAVKPSPYATFAHSGFGRWTESGPAVVPSERLDFQVLIELDRRVIEYLWTVLSRRPDVRGRAAVRVNPSATDDGSRIWFCGAGLDEPLANLAATDSLRRLLAAVRAEPELTMGTLLARLPSGQGGAVEALVRAGLLELPAPFADQSTDPLGDLADWLARPGDDGTGDDGTGDAGPVAGSVVAAVRGLRAVVRPDRGVLGADDHGTRLAEIRRNVTDTFLALDGVDPRLPDLNLCLDSALLTHPPVQAGAGQWRPALDDLDLVRRFLAIFDLDLPVKLAATTYFLSRYGAEAAVPVLEFYRQVHTDGVAGDERDVLLTLLRDRLAPHLGTLRRSPLSRLRELAAHRAQAWEAITGPPDGPGGVSRADPELVAKLIDTWPRSVVAPGSVCVYLQPTDTPDGLGVVINTATAGYGRGLTRLWRLMDLVGAEVPPVADLRAPAGDQVLAECRAALHSSVNLRPATGDVELEYPYATGGGELPALPLTDLRVRYDHERDRLVLTGPDSRAVLPVHLGLLAEYYLPSALRFLVRVFGEPGTAMAPGWVFRGSRVPPAVESHPRMDIGRVTLARACWRLRSGEFPIPAKGESDPAYLPRLADWLAGHGIPRRFFARVVNPQREPLVDGLLGKARKPFYVDVTNAFLLTGFTRTIATDPDALMVLEEVLPDPADAPTYGRHGVRVTEYVVQVSATARDGGTGGGDGVDAR
ncbi:lantibiotic dehydratase [Plantactinospora sp. S1510]|uniref:Lantibiotic dehydratase n=1 Tax=Plantactinospora alkalitolerans TaxID=2789879 RepID=A0ABS0H5E2_9ACTN|nr:lantibiotic dehydratase [Plantactinospora alkalitolerans]MBF9133684.1 lantibiotic dehydratase [Plantactinospora alkalitolerans]